MVVNVLIDNLIKLYQLQGLFRVEWYKPCTWKVEERNCYTFLWRGWKKPGTSQGNWYLSRDSKWVPLDLNSPCFAMISFWTKNRSYFLGDREKERSTDNWDNYSFVIIRLVVLEGDSLYRLQLDLILKCPRLVTLNTVMSLFKCVLSWWLVFV